MYKSLIIALLLSPISISPANAAPDEVKRVLENLDQLVKDGEQNTWNDIQRNERSGNFENAQRCIQSWFDLYDNPEFRNLPGRNQMPEIRDRIQKKKQEHEQAYAKRQRFQSVFAMGLGVFVVGAVAAIVYFVFNEKQTEKETEKP